MTLLGGVGVWDGRLIGRERADTPSNLSSCSGVTHNTSTVSTHCWPPSHTNTPTHKTHKHTNTPLAPVPDPRSSTRAPFSSPARFFTKCWLRRTPLVQMRLPVPSSDSSSTASCSCRPGRPILAAICFVSGVDDVCVRKGGVDVRDTEREERGTTGGGCE